MAARKVRTCTDDNGRRRILRCADDPKRAQLCEEVCGFLPKSSATLHDDEQCGGFDETERYEFPDVRFVDPWRGVFVEWEGEGDGPQFDRSVNVQNRTAPITWNIKYGPNGNNVLRDQPDCYSYRSHSTAFSNFTSAPAKPETGVAIEIGHHVAGSVRVTDCVQLGSVDGLYSRMIGRVVNVLPTGACDSAHRNSSSDLRFPLYRGDSRRLTVSLSGMAGCGCSLSSYTWTNGRWVLSKVTNPFARKDDCTQRDVAGDYAIDPGGSGERLIVLSFTTADHSWQQGDTKGNAESTIVIEDIA